VATVTDYGTYTLPSGVVVLLAPPLAPPTPPAPAPADQFVQRQELVQTLLSSPPVRLLSCLAPTSRIVSDLLVHHHVVVLPVAE
jgi:hypothetical protein